MSGILVAATTAENTEHLDQHGQLQEVTDAQDINDEIRNNVPSSNSSNNPTGLGGNKHGP